MRTLTIHIEDLNAEKALLEYLDRIGLKYSVDLNDSTYAWWEDQQLIEELNTRSRNLKNGDDSGLSFAEIKHRLLSK